MVSALTIARTELVRLLRDRSNLFFVFVFPLLLVLLIGASFGAGADQRIAVAVPTGDEPAAALVEAIDAADGVATDPVDDGDAVEDQVGRGLASAGLVIEPGYGEAVAAARPAEVAFVARPDAGSLTLRALVDEAVADQAARLMAVDAAAEALDTDPDELRDVADTLARVLPEVRVTTTEVGGDELAREFAGLGQFDLGASTQLFLFTFLTSLSGGAALIQTRRLGIASRMLATPAPIGAILLGQAGGRFLIAVLQAAYIVAATVLLFQVDWGPPVITAVVVLLFCAASAGAGMLIGATFRNDSQAAGIGVGLGIGLAALGGSMVPLELFGDGMQLAASITPHAWANRAMAELVRRDGGWTDVTTELLVLAGFAVGLLALATWRLRRTLLR